MAKKRETSRVYYDLNDLAERWRVHPKTVARWLREGCSGRGPIKPLVLGRKQLYPAGVVELWERQ